MTSSAEQQARLSAVLGSKYQILCRIGGGGMAQVYLARHRFHGGLFAVKVLAEYLAGDPAIVSRFEHEARMAASLANHPNIVPVFDIGRGEGLHFLVMQFIPGEDLASYLHREGRLDLASAANVVAQATEALSCAEAKRIVHRDLKPANMLLDENGRIKLLDFGISRINDRSDGLTRPGESLGTPYYMSPEQIRGEACDIRSDLYSLGVVFFELLTGSHPFENESATAVQMAHLTTPPPSLLSVDAGLPSACDAIIQKLLEKLPEARYQSTAELLQVLTSYGATTGPGSLRPKISDGLQEAIQRTQSLPLDDQTVSVPASPDAAPTIAPAPQVTAAVAVPAAPMAPPSGPVEEKRSGSKVWILLVAAVVVVAAAVAGVVLMRRGKTPTIANSTGSPAAGPSSSSPPSVYNDAHGRMLLVPAGSFVFTSAVDGKNQPAALPAFYIDETEVSNAEYQRFCSATGHGPPQTAGYAEHPDEPVSGVSYDDAQAYATWAGKRLPTEEEWEKAARGSDGRLYPWGNTPWTQDVPTVMQPVSSDPLHRSPYGAYNMAGNVWEWTATAYSPTPAETAHMTQLLHGQNFSAQWRMTKGGSFAPGGGADFAVTKGRGLPSDARSPWIGFRCVRDLAGTF